MTKEELIQQYVENTTTIEGLTSMNKNILKELGAFEEHKVGEIVKWVEHPKKNVGSYWRPKYEELPPVEHTAVLTKVEATIFVWNEKPSLRYRQEFKPIKKDGEISKNNCLLIEDTLTWTGEIHKDYLNKE